VDRIEAYRIIRQAILDACESHDMHTDRLAISEGVVLVNSKTMAVNAADAAVAKLFGQAMEMEVTR
jgi:hypothetical protein